MQILKTFLCSTPSHNAYLGFVATVGHTVLYSVYRPQKTGDDRNLFFIRQDCIIPGVYQLPYMVSVTERGDQREDVPVEFSGEPG